MPSADLFLHALQNIALGSFISIKFLSLYLQQHPAKSKFSIIFENGTVLQIWKLSVILFSFLNQTLLISHNRFSMIIYNHMCLWFISDVMKLNYPTFNNNSDILIILGIFLRLEMGKAKRSRNFNNFCRRYWNLYLEYWSWMSGVIVHCHMGNTHLKECQQ